MYIRVPGFSTLIYFLCRFPGLLIVLPIVLGVMLFCPGSPLPNQCLPEGVISFAFDGGHSSAYTQAFPVLKKYGYKGTVFVVTSLIDQPGYLTTEQILDLAKEGWEIASQGVHYVDLTNLSEEELEYELRVSKEHLENLPLKVEGFASPYGKYNEQTLTAISKYYFFHRLSGPDGLNELPLQKAQDRYLLKSVMIKDTAKIEWIIKAKKEHKWLILLFDGDNWSVESLEEISRFVFREGFRGVLPTEVP